MYTAPLRATKYFGSLKSFGGNKENLNWWLDRTNITPYKHANQSRLVFGIANDLARAKTEFDIALRMAPNQFEILTFYIGWASTFGEPERGAQLVDEAVRLNPSYPMWSARIFAYAYFMVGRYDDALRMLDRVEAENLGTWMWPFRAGALAALGRDVEAKAAVKEALTWYPNLTIEGTVNEPGYSKVERARVTETMRLAGFPACAKPEALAKIEKPLRLPECQSQP